MAKIEKKTTGKKRRRIRWGRVVIFLTIVGAVLSAFAWGTYHAYVAARETYENYRSLLAEFKSSGAAESKYQDPRFTEFTNILILGIDEGDPANPLSGKQSDTVIVAALNHANGMMNLLSIPGDTLVDIPGRKTKDKISRAYYYGGTQLAVRATEDFLQAPIHHFIVIDPPVFTQIVDVLGGVDVYVESDMNYEDAYAGFKINLKKGYQHLGGEEAAQYVRYRGDELGDIGRVQRQQKFLKLIYAKAIDVDTIVKLPEIMDLINRNVTTSMAVLDTAKIAKNLKGFQPDLMKTKMLPGNFQTERGESVWIADQEKIDRLLDEIYRAEPEKAEEAEKEEI